jgi:predicted extracellular nuclease
MKIRILFIFLALLCLEAYAQSDTVTVYQIQYQNPDSLLLHGDRKSPYEGDTVTVTGVVMNRTMKDSTTRMLNSGANAVYLQDPNYNEYAAILVRYVGTQSSKAFNDLDTGYVIRVTGIVQEYYQTTQLNISSFQAEDVLGVQVRPEPIELPLDSIVEKGTGAYKASAEKWEAMRLKVKDLVVTDANASGVGAFRVIDANSTPVIVYNQSNYFRNIPSPNPGAVLEYVIGHLSTDLTYGNELNPVYPEDRKFGNVVPPVISNVKRDSAVVKYGQEVKVSADIKDLDGTVISAQLYYSVNDGALTNVKMAKDSADIWSGKIPALDDSSYVEYFIKASDDQLNTIISPGDTTTSRYSYFVLNRPLTIKEIQYSPRGSGYSSYNGFIVTVSGVVTSDTNYIYIQDGSGPWCGINLFLTDSVKIGDNISVTGRVEESYYLTRITAITDLVRNSSNNPLPEPVELSTADIGEAVNNSVGAEQWEGVLVKYKDVTVTAVNADGNPGPDEGTGGNRNYGEMFVADESGVNTRVELQDGMRHKYHNLWSADLANNPDLVGLNTGDKFSSVTGYVEYTFSEYKIVPRYNSDFEGYIPVVVDGVKEIIPGKFGLSQNYPNPFNPSTLISYSVPLGEFVTIKIYNLLGQEIKTLVNKYQNAGNYNVTFNANNLPTGIYFYQMQAGSFRSVKKMVLMK